MGYAKIFLVLSGFSGAIATVFGAFGAHALRNKIPSHLFQAYSTGVNYQFIHTLALLAVSILLMFNQSLWLKSSAISFTFGMLLFSGSLYALALGGNKLWGPVTPIGGVLFIIGWVLLVIAAVKMPVPCSPFA